MYTIPVCNMVLLPDVTFFLKKEVFHKWNVDTLEEGAEILFLLLREQKDLDKTTAEDYYEVGFVAELVSIDPEDVVQMRVIKRVTIQDIENEAGVITATAVTRKETESLPKEIRSKRFQKLKEEYLEFIQGFQWGVWVRNVVQRWDTMEEMLCSSAGYLTISWDDKYQLMAEDSVAKRYDRMEQIIHEFFAENRVLDEAQKAEQASHEQMYREAALKKQINYMQQQLQEMHPENESEIAQFERKISESGMNETARKEAEKVLGRMKQDGKEGHEYGMLYDYLEFVTSLSWKKESVPEIDLKRVIEVLDSEHYGLKKVKERIVEQMAVMALNKKQSGSILLFAGAPGTGKTSIGQSIARSLGRKYVRISLGGIRDEAEIRGHRRTYIGAMPGRIMDGIKRSGVSNPVVVLDEVDKLAKDFGGDPASALLEVLDPEQNSTFTDHYMNVPYDLSDVLFICTANSVDTIPEPLLNRMELIQFPGYTAIEKYNIARKHLIPGLLKETGIPKGALKISEKAIQRMIAEYTAEAGVRGLKKQIGELCRKAAVKLVSGESRTVSVGAKKLPEFLGNSRIRHDQKNEKAIPGVVTGLAWTSAGGDILFIETRLIKGSGKLMITGQLGDVMKESIQIAVSLVKSMYPKEAEQLKDQDLHIHVPAGAVPKDGPSAGITIVTALVSLITGKTVSTELAMTGEISLRGKVLPIGGLPEKLLAAQRAGILKVLIPDENEQDLEEVAEEIKEKLTILPVKEISDVIKIAFK